MAVRIAPTLIQNLQEMEVVVAGPEDANRLVIIDGQFDCNLYVNSSGVWATAKETRSLVVRRA